MPIQTPMPSAVPPLRLERHPDGRAVRSLIGAGLGFLVFLFVGLLPTLLAGGTTGINLANLVFGVEGTHETGFRTFAFLGVVFATTAGAALFAALGAAIGAAVGELSGDRVAHLPGR